MKKETVNKFVEFLKKRENRELPFVTKLMFFPESIDWNSPVATTTIDFSDRVLEDFIEDEVEILYRLPENLTIDGDLVIMYTPFTELPKKLKISGDLYIGGTAISKLPDNLHVGRCDAQTSSLSMIPRNLKIEKDFLLSDTPLSKRYKKEEIKKMIEDRGGYVKGMIFVTWEEEYAELSKRSAER